MFASLFGKITFRPLFFLIAPGSCTNQRSPCINPLANLIGEQNELAGAQDPIRRSNDGSNKAPTPFEALTLPLVSFPFQDLFKKFMKVFMETTQAQAQALAEPQEHLLKPKTPETY